MIPYFIVDAMDWIACKFGYQAYVTARSDHWAADRVHFVYNPSAERLPRLRARK